VLNTKSAYCIERLVTRITLFLLGISLTATALADSYDYPFSNPYIATIVGTPKEFQAELPLNIPLERHSLVKEVGPELPDVFWYQEGLSYSLAVQEFNAPLIFVIAGTGADYKSEKNMVLLKSFYQAGFHVVGLTSPSHQNFITTASRSAIPGHMEEDAFDLYRVMQRINNNLAPDIEVSKYLLTGYSLGGAHAAYVSQLDQEEQLFDFDRVLLLNPPLSLYASISKLDRMLENIPGGVDHFSAFFDTIVQRISEAYKRSSKAEFNEALVFEAFKHNPPSHEQLAAIIGTAFRFSASGLMFTSDTMINAGFIKPRELNLGVNDSLQNYLRLSMRIGFTDYFHELFFPYFLSKHPSLTRESLVGQLSLLYIEDYLRGAAKIGLVHNRDDVILVDGDIEAFEYMFGARAKIFPSGGHLGNLQQRDVLNYIVDFFK